MRIINLSLFLFVLAIQINYSQEGFGIHKLEADKYRTLKLEKSFNEVDGLKILPLNKSIQKNLSKAVFGYFPDWEYQNNAQNNFDYTLLTHIAAFDFPISSTGQISEPWGWPWTNVINDAHSNGVKVIMSLTNFNLTTTQMHSFLTNAFSRWGFLVSLQNKIIKYNLDGVNIDFEGLATADRGALINDFMQDVSDSVHSISPDLEVSFAAPAVNWGGWDLNGLANSCDYLFVMGYDFFGSWSTTTGPTAPLASGSYNVTNTINNEYYSVTSTHPDKLILGVPYYGPHWTAESSSQGATVIQYVNAKRFRDAQPESEIYGLEWSTTFKNPWYNYLESSIHHQVWFDDSTSLGLKYDLAVNKNLKGVGMWALGYDGTRKELWNLLEKKFSIPVNVDNDDVIPTSFNLEQNYPNPFNPATVIRYSIPQSSVMLNLFQHLDNSKIPKQVRDDDVNVTLKVYDILGRELETLVNKSQSAGNYEVTFNAASLPSGVYYYTLRNNNYFETKKMLLIK